MVWGYQSILNMQLLIAGPICMHRKIDEIMTSMHVKLALLLCSKPADNL